MLRGWLGSSAMECALRAVAVMLRSEIGVGSPMILAAVCVIYICLFLLGADSMLKD